MAFAIYLRPLTLRRMNAIERIHPFAENKDNVHITIDTPRCSRNKLKWDRKLQVLKLNHVLTAGAVFPFDFGFVPGTQGPRLRRSTWDLEIVDKSKLPKGTLLGVLIS